MEMIKNSMKNHPYFSVFYLWLFLFCSSGRFSVEWVSLFNYISSAFLILMLIPMNQMYMKKVGAKNIDKQNRIKFVAGVSIVAAYSILTLFLYGIIPSNKHGWGRNATVLFISGAVFFCVTALYLKKKRMLSGQKLFVLIILAAFFFHFYYNLYSEFNVQADLYFYDARTPPQGHMGYMKYLYENFLPYQEDPRPLWQFYHPPLHHYLEAGLMRLQTLLGTDIEIAVFNIKYLPLLYFMLMCITVKKIAEMLTIKGNTLIFVMSVVLFSPAFLIIGNYANNDMLSIFLMIQSIYFALIWYKDQKAENIIKVALCFGLSMFTKLSGWMAAVPIAVVFITALINMLRHKKFSEFRKLIGQMSVFMLIAAPLSLYWSIRNYVRFGVPVGYIPISESEYQRINQSVPQRLFDFSFYQFETPYLNDLKVNDYVEFNPLVALIKTSSANLHIDKAFGAPFDTLNLCTMWVTIILAAVAFVCMIFVLCKKGTMPIYAKIAMISFYIVLLVSYYIFCINYPYTCTEDIRYASPIIIIGAFSVGIVMEKNEVLNKKVNSKLQLGMKVIITAFCLLSFLSFAADGLWTSLYFNML